MASYIVLEPTDAVKLKPLFRKKGASAVHVKGDHTVFVRDEFTVIALILPFLWLLVHRLWWHALMIALIGWGAFSLLGRHFSSAELVTGLSLLLSLFVALEGRNWYLASLKRKGYEEVAALDAKNLHDAEIMYFYGDMRFDNDAEAQQQIAEPQNLQNNMTNGVPATADNTMIGLVEYRGRS